MNTKEGKVNLNETAESAPLHEWTNGDLQSLIDSIRRNKKAMVAQRPLFNKAVQLLQERGVKVVTLLGVSIFAEA